MRVLLRLKSRSVLCFLIASCVLLSCPAFADTGSMNCPGRMPATHAQLVEGDQNSSSHLQLSRKIASSTEVHIDVCAADLTITGGSDSFRVTVDLGSPSTQYTAADYLQTLEVSPGKVTLQLHLPKSARAKVLVEIPSQVPGLQVNLGRGNLSLVADRVGGERDINVGYGHVDFQGNADAYESLQVNVGLGSLHDHRKGGESHHLIVAHGFEGTGKGSIEINVGMGSVDLNSGHGQPI